MNISSRNRIIGAMFIVGALGIGLPFLFDTPLERADIDLDQLPRPTVSPLEVEPLPQSKPDVNTLIEVREEIRAEIGENGIVNSTGTRLGAPVIGQEDINTTKWAVQVASLSKREDARKFAAGLAADGYSAWVSDIMTDAKILHRVVVGPMTVRDEALAVSAELAEKYRVHPMLVSFDLQ